MDDLCTAVDLLLKLSRDQISDGKPFEALSNVVQAIVMTQGEGALLHVLDEAKRKADEENQALCMQSTLEGGIFIYD